MYLGRRDIDYQPGTNSCSDTIKGSSDQPPSLGLRRARVISDQW